MIKPWNIAALVLLGFSALVSNLFLFKPITHEKSDQTRHIAKSLGKWHFLNATPASEAEVRILETADIIKWSYADGHNIVELVVAYIPRSNRKSAHSQETCLRGSGANVGQLVTKRLQKSPVSAKMITITSRGQTSLVYYWFKIKKKYTAAFLTSSLNLFLGGLSGKDHGAALIRVMTPYSAAEGEKPAHDRLEDFTHYLIPELEKHLP